MTKREFLEKVQEAAINEEITEFAVAEVAKLDKTNETRKGKENAKTAEFNAYVSEVAEGIPVNTVITATELAATLGISVQKTSSVLRRATEMGFFTSAEIKVTGKGKAKAYTRV